MQKSTPLIFIILLIQGSLSRFFHTWQCDHPDAFRKNIETQFGITIDLDKLKCEGVTEIRDEKPKGMVYKHYTLNYDGCEAKLVLDKALSRNEAHCIHECLAPFAKCVE